MCRVITMKFYWFIGAFLFFKKKDKKLKKLVVALKFLCFLTVLSSNSNVFFLLVLFACKDPSTLYKSSKRRNHLKTENLETIFLLSALKMPIKSYKLPRRNKILRRRTLLWFLQLYIYIRTFKCVKFSKILRGVAHKQGVWQI